MKSRIMIGIKVESFPFAFLLFFLFGCNGTEVKQIEKLQQIDELQQTARISGIFYDYLPKEYNELKGLEFKNQNGESLKFFQIGTSTTKSETLKGRQYRFDGLNTSIALGFEINEPLTNKFHEQVKVFMVDVSSYPCSVNAIDLRFIDSTIVQHGGKIENCYENNLGIESDCFCGKGRCVDSKTQEPIEYEICLEKYKGITRFLYKGMDYRFANYR